MLKKQWQDYASKARKIAKRIISGIYNALLKSYYLQFRRIENAILTTFALQTRRDGQPFQYEVNKTDESKQFPSKVKVQNSKFKGAMRHVAILHPQMTQMTRINRRTLPLPSPNKVGKQKGRQVKGSTKATNY